MREENAYDMSEFDAKARARIHYQKKRESQCRERKNREFVKFSCKRDRGRDNRAAKIEYQIMKDKWREYIETPFEVSY